MCQLNRTCDVTVHSPQFSVRELNQSIFREVMARMQNQRIRTNRPILPNVPLIMNEAGKPLV